jgi:hypothetical protein
VSDALKKNGGDDEDRTHDLLNANQALSQLSYVPFKVVGLVRLELTTPPLSRVCSNQLSYKPVNFKPFQMSKEDAFQAEILGSYSGKKRYEDSSGALPKKKDQPNNILRKEVIQPQVPLRLPCYDFTPVIDPTVVACLQS